MCFSSIWSAILGFLFSCGREFQCANGERQRDERGWGRGGTEEGEKADEPLATTMFVQNRLLADGLSTTDIKRVNQCLLEKTETYYEKLKRATIPLKLGTVRAFSTKRKEAVYDENEKTILLRKDEYNFHPISPICNIQIPVAGASP